MKAWPPKWLFGGMKAWPPKWLFGSMKAWPPKWLFGGMLFGIFMLGTIIWFMPGYCIGALLTRYLNSMATYPP